MARIPLAEVQARTYKQRDSWWTVLLVDPIAGRLTRLIAPYRWFTPNRITLLASVAGLCAAALFVRGGTTQNHWLLVAGALAYHLSFVFDCIDGKIARLNGTGSVFGAWLDFILDRLRIVLCTVALMGGQYAATKNMIYLWLAGAVVFLDMFRYLNASEIAKANRELKSRLEDAGIEPELEPPTVRPGAPVKPGRFSMLALVDGSSVGTVGLGPFQRMRAALRRSRIRPHLVGGIEFQMSVLVISPIVGAIVPITIGVGSLMIFFEAALVYLLYKSTVAVARQTADYRRTLDAQLAPLTAEAPARAQA